jgi:hypothetical protein
MKLLLELPPIFSQISAIPNLTTDPHGQNGLNRYGVCKKIQREKNYGIKRKLSYPGVYLQGKNRFP